MITEYFVVFIEYSTAMFMIICIDRLLLFTCLVNLRILNKFGILDQFDLDLHCLLSYSARMFKVNTIRNNTCAHEK